MLIRLILAPADEHRSGANQMRQQLSFREHFRRGNAAFVVIGAAELFWIVTAWPNGASAVAWAAIGVILLALRADHAYDAAIVYMLGTGLAVAFAALVKFAVLPQVVTYFGFSLIIGLYLVPTGALIAQPRHPALFTAMAANFVPLLAPTNEMNYDTEQFYNGALAIVAGLTAATLSFRLIPPLSPAFRSRRLLALTLRDLRRLAMGPIPRTPADWQGHIYGRLSALPDAPNHCSVRSFWRPCR